MQSQPLQDFHPQRIIIKFKSDSKILFKVRSIVPGSISESFVVNNTNDNSLNKFFSDFDIQYIKAVKPGKINFPLPAGVERIFIAEIKNPLLLNQVIASLNSQPYIEYAEKDFIGGGSGVKVDNQSSENNNSDIIPNDPFFNLQWGLRNTGQVINGVAGVAGADINITGGWDITTGSPSTKLAILDSGIPLGASEFSGRILPGYDFANNDNDPTDDQGHGTNVTSIAAAKGNNSSLITGVNWNCKIIPIKILNSSNSGFYSWWISGITMAADSGAKVLSMSVGGN
ncbi:MAG: S8 family serine peptidase, partial [bacterium]